MLAAPEDPLFQGWSSTGSSLPKDSVNTEFLDGDNTMARGIIQLNVLVLNGVISLTRVPTPPPP